MNLSNMLQNLPINPVVKYEYFRKFFTENFKINFAKPKSDTCTKCDKLLNKINAADSDAEKKPWRLRSPYINKKLNLLYRVES